MKTPDNVRMVSTSPSKLAWLLAGIVYPANADENPDVYMSEFAESYDPWGKERRSKPRSGRIMAANFIEKLLSKVRWG